MDGPSTSHENDSSSNSIAHGEQNVQTNAHNATKDSLTEKKERPSSYVVEKTDDIRQACDLRDLDALVSYATSEGGYLRDDLRQLACKSIRYVLQTDR